jgi:hypothetical protein
MSLNSMSPRRSAETVRGVVAAKPVQYHRHETASRHAQT